MKNPQLALSELAKQTQLPVATLRRAITGGTRLNPANLITTIANRNTSELTPEAKAESRAITGQFVTVDKETENSDKEKSNPTLVAVPNDGNPDKLQMTIEALKANADMTDEALAEYLSLKRPASARFWRLKAIEILNASETKETTESPVAAGAAWATTGALANGTGAKR